MHSLDKGCQREQINPKGGDVLSPSQNGTITQHKKKVPQVALQLATLPSVQQFSVQRKSTQQLTLLNLQVRFPPNLLQICITDLVMAPIPLPCLHMSIIFWSGSLSQLTPAILFSRF